MFRYIAHASIYTNRVRSAVPASKEICVAQCIPRPSKTSLRYVVRHTYPIRVMLMRNDVSWIIDSRILNSEITNNSE